MKRKNFILITMMIIGVIFVSCSADDETETETETEVLKWNERAGDYTGKVGEADITVNITALGAISIPISEVFIVTGNIKATDLNTANSPITVSMTIPGASGPTVVDFEMEIVSDKAISVDMTPAGFGVGEFTKK